MDRRSFLNQLGSFSGGLALACSGLGNRAAHAQTGDLSRFRSAGYGGLIPTKALNSDFSYLALPPGFRYTAIGNAGNVMSDGNKTPTKHDGMATFNVGGELRIVRNHEVTNDKVPIIGSAIGTSNHYDETAGGGTTTLVIDPKTRLLKRDFVSLSGTLINCAGGPTPWGSWISCEETTLGPGIRTSASGKKTGGFAKPHGYCFEVPASANSAVAPVPLKAMGRFTHEAIGVDKKSGVVYLTEDFKTAGFYRFLPARNKRLAEGGVLQALKIAGKDAYETRKGQKAGTAFNTAWVTIDNPDPESADIDEAAVINQGIAKGAAIFSRLEGIFVDPKGRVYFDSTDGGDKGAGQIWMYTPTGKDQGILTLMFETPDREILDMPDNICLRPKTDLLFICEDSDYLGLSGKSENFVRIMTPDGRIADFAKNITPNQEGKEFAGSTFTKDGKTMFVNLQSIDVTLAIWGDWEGFKY
jgi:secreted PhoX family phosphatase